MTERKTRSSRPDIIIDNVAIEIKGPTDMDDLRSIPDKIMRYTSHYDVLIIVLYDLRVNTNKHGYLEWEEGIEKLKDLPGIGDISIIHRDEFSNE